MQLAEERDGPDSPQLVRFLRGLSVIESNLGNHETALALNERSLAISEATHGPESFELIADLTNLGISYRTLGRNEDARIFLARAIQVGTERSPEHDQLALPLAQLGLVEQAEGNHRAAVDTLLRALAINTKVLGATHDQTGETHIFLASVYEDMGDYASAEPHLDAAIKAFEAGWRYQQ
jgi:tetratricopeptide (TPR) repeat protein